MTAETGLEPTRPLGAPGRAVWERYVNRTSTEPLLKACELADEHHLLRVRVIRDGDPADRRALRDLDTALAIALDALDREASWTQYREAHR